MRTRTGRLLAGAVIVALAAGGCASGPSKVDAAAVIGDDTVTLAQVQPQISAALAQPDLVSTLRAGGLGPQDIGRSIVGRTIVHELLERAAAERNIVVRDDEVTAAAAEPNVGQSSSDPIPDVRSARDRARDELLETKLAAAELDRLSVTVQSVRASSQQQAESLGRSLAAQPLPVTPPNAKARPSVSPAVAELPLIGVPLGDVVIVPVDEQTWNIYRVVQRNPDDTPAGPATTRLPRPTLAAAGRWLLIPEALRLGITVNPRYGVWDPVLLTVAPDPSQTVQLIPAPSPAR